MKVTLAVQSWGPAHACLSCQMETWLGKGERMCESISQTYGAALGGKWGLGWLEHAHPGGSFCSCLSLHSDLQPWVCVPVSLLWITEVFRDLHWEMVGFFMELRATYWCVWREIPVLSGLCWHFCCHQKLLAWTEVGVSPFGLNWCKSVELPLGEQRCVAVREHEEHLIFGHLLPILYLEVFLDGQKSLSSLHFIYIFFFFSSWCFSWACWICVVGGLHFSYWKTKEMKNRTNWRAK